MYKFTLFLVLSLITLSTHAQDTINHTDKHGLKQGLWKIQMDEKDEVSYALIRYVNNIMEGEFKGFYDDGNIAIKGKFINNKIDGSHIMLFRTGETRIETTYKMGLIEGQRIEYYKNKQKAIVEGYKHDTLISYKSFHKNGNKLIEYFQKKGKLDGVYKLHHENGSIHLKGNYINGAKNGLWYRYSNDGKIEKIEEYKMGKQKVESK